MVAAAAAAKVNRPIVTVEEINEVEEAGTVKGHRRRRRRGYAVAGLSVYSY